MSAVKEEMFRLLEESLEWSAHVHHHGLKADYNCRFCMQNAEEREEVEMVGEEVEE